MVLSSNALAFVNWTVLLGPPIFSEQPSINTRMVYLQNIPQSVTVRELRRYSYWIWEAGSRRTMSYEMSKISRKVKLRCWNHEPCFMDFDSEHLTPATFFRLRHPNPSGILGSTDHVISRPQLLHCALLRSRPMSFRNCIPKPLSQKRYVRKLLF